jgi:ribosomal-protein-alanine N-acetyltransferase
LTYNVRFDIIAAMETLSSFDMILTDRLVLRLFNAADANDVFEFAGDKTDANRFVAWPAHEECADSVRCIRDIYIPNRVFAIEYSGKCIGAIELKSTEEDGVYSIGYILNKKFWNLGFTTEALTALLDVAFRRLKAKSVVAAHAVENKASGRVMEKCGLKVERIALKELELRCGLSDIRHMYIDAEAYFKNQN